MPSKAPWPYLSRPGTPELEAVQDEHRSGVVSGAPSFPPTSSLLAYQHDPRPTDAGLHDRASFRAGQSTKIRPSNDVSDAKYSSRIVPPAGAEDRTKTTSNRAVSYAGQSSNPRIPPGPSRALSHYQSPTRVIRGPRPLIEPSDGTDSAATRRKTPGSMDEEDESFYNAREAPKDRQDVRPFSTAPNSAISDSMAPRSTPSSPTPAARDYGSFPFATPSLETVSAFDFSRAQELPHAPGKTSKGRLSEQGQAFHQTPSSPSSLVTRDSMFDGDATAGRVSRSGTSATVGSSRSQRSAGTQRSVEKGRATGEGTDLGQVQQENAPWPIIPFAGFKSHLMSHLARGLLIVAPRSSHTFGANVFPDCATAPEIVDALLALLPLHLMTSRQLAVDIARSLEHDGLFGKVTEAEAGLQDSNDEIYFLPWEDQVTSSTLSRGVVVEVLGCYSATCPRDETCYSCKCPYRQPTDYAQKDHKPRVKSIEESVTKSTLPGPGKAWAETVSKEVLGKLTKDEIKRQNIIAETIETEREYVRDLETIQKVFIHGITTSKPPLISPNRQKKFLKEAFANAENLRVYNSALLKLLEDRQKEEHPVISQIGDLFLGWAVDSGSAYIAYNAHFPWADHMIRRERATNVAFDTFLKHCASLTETRRLEFRHFIQRPTQRLQRYTLLLESTIKATADGNDDKIFLQEALQTIKDLCRQSDTQLAESERKLKLKHYHENLIYKAGEPLDLDLLNPARQIVHEGKVERKSSGFEWIEVQLILLDNYLVMTKLIGKEPMQKFRVSKRPIPLEMLQIHKVAETPVHKSGTGFHMPTFSGDRAPTAKDFMGPLTGVVANGSPANGTAALVQAPLAQSGAADEEGLLYPITLAYIGRLGSTTTVYCSSAFERDRWRGCLQTTLAKRAQYNQSREAFEMVTISRGVFGYTAIAHSKKDKGPQKYKGRVTCIASFIGSDRSRMIIVGTDEGAWLGFEDDPASLQQVLHLKYIQQIAVLAQFRILLALADRTLIAYALEAILPSLASKEGKEHLRQPQRLSAPKEVSFFKTGVVNGRTLVVTCKKKGVESIFRCLEPVHMFQEKKTLGRMFGGNKSDWFREYKNFFIPSDAYSLQFLNRMLCIVCEKGFEIVNLDTLQPSTIPNWQDPNWAKLGKSAGSTMAKRAQQAHALGIFRIDQNEFLLCYDELGTVCEKHGEFSRDMTIEWEGKPESFVLYHPYILGFDARFVEVRLAATGELVQIIPGTNIKCLTDSVTMNLPTDMGGSEATRDKFGKTDSLLCCLKDVPTDSYSIVKLVPIKR